MLQMPNVYRDSHFGPEQLAKYPLDAEQEKLEEPCLPNLTGDVALGWDPVCVWLGT